MAKMKWRYESDGLELEASLAAQVICLEEEDKTVQSAKDDADINTLVKRFGVDGIPPALNVQPFYGDFTGVEDFRDSLHRVMEAERAFLAMPVEVRNRFENDPAKLMEFVHGPRTEEVLAEGRRMGLFEPEVPPPAPMRVEVVNPTPPAGGAPAGAPGA